jgi:hypothetical protein
MNEKAGMISLRLAVLLASHIVLLVVAIAPAWSENSVGANRGAHKLPFQPIVGGHNLQPRQDQLDSVHVSDLDAAERAQVERIYWELERRSEEMLKETESGSVVSPTIKAHHESCQAKRSCARHISHHAPTHR